MVRNSLVGIAAAIALCAGSTATLAQVGTAFSYQGQLKDSGTAVTGTVDMQFSLWTAATGGSQVGSTVTKLAVPAAGGLLTTNVDFGTNPYTADQALYLQISVRNPAGSGTYVQLASRQRLTAAPFSLATRGLAVTGNGSVGIGGAAQSRFSVIGPDNGAMFRVVDFPPSAGTQMVGEFTGAGNNGAQLRFESGALGFVDMGMNGVGDFVIEGSDAPVITATQTGKVGIGVTSPFNRLDVPAGSIIGSSAVVGTDSQDVANRGTKVSFGYNYVTGNCGPTHFSGMNVVVNPGTNFCGNSVDLTFYTEECNTACPREVMRINGRGNVGIGTATPSSSFKLDVAGNVRCVSLTQTSSREFKQDIVPLTGALESIMKLNGVTYAWNDLAPEQVRGAHDIGFLADEMNAVLPDIVAKDESGKPVGIDYGKITPVAVEAIKQLKNENDQLKVRLEKLELLMAERSAK